MGLYGLIEARAEALRASEPRLQMADAFTLAFDALAAEAGLEPPDGGFLRVTPAPLREAPPGAFEPRWPAGFQP